MKRLLLLHICLVLFLFGQNGLLGALELEIIGGINNLTYHPDRDIPYSQSSNHRQFKPYPFGLANISLRGDITGILEFDISIKRDNILRNNINSTFISRTDYFRFEFGPFIGIDDSFNKPHAGIIGGIEFTLPGTAFLSLSGSSTLGSQLDFTSNNFQEHAGIKLGFWLPNVIPSLSANFKSFSKYHNEFFTTRDMLTRIHASVDLFSKNSPFTCRIDAGYETLTRVYKRGNTETTDALSAFFAGLEMNIQIMRPFRLIIGLETPVYYTAAAPMTMPAEFWTLFKAYLGFTYTFF
jgi:hypothetical protein